MMNRLFKPFIFCFLLTAFVSGLISCEKNLSAGGIFDVSSQGLNAKIRVFSDYYVTYPTFITELSSGNYTVPRDLLVPKISFGQLENALIHTNRTIPSVPVPIDMYLTAYTESSDFPDFYFETPVLGSQNILTNTSTALSWILKWSFGSNKIKISKNQFDDLIGKVEIACSNCRRRTNTELVNFILNNANLSSFVLSAVKASNRDLPDVVAQANLNYTPPSAIFANSDPIIGTNWTISQVGTEPTEFSAVNSKKVLDIVFVQPTRSPDPLKPDSWTHSVRYDDDPLTTIAQTDIEDTPLIYDITVQSSGVHSFNSIFSNIVSAPPVVATLTVTNKNATPNCYTNPPTISLRAGKRFKLNLDNTIIPTVTGSGNLSTSEVAFENINQLPTETNATIYHIVFSTGATTQYVVSKTVISSALQSIITPSTKYQSGEVIYFEGYALKISGTPANGDVVSFRSPNLGQKLINGLPDNAANTANRVNGVGCFDPDFSRTQSVTFEPVNTPFGLSISSNGLISWAPRSLDYTSQTTDVTVVYNIKDTFGATQQVSQTLKVLKDNIPVICADGQLTSDATFTTNRCPSPTVLTELPIDGASPVSYLDVDGVTRLYAEGTSINEPLHFMDADGDPLLLSVSVTNGTLVESANAQINSFTPLFSGSSIFSATSGTLIQIPDPVNPTNPTSASMYNANWMFRPSSLQVENIASSTLTFKFTLSYNTTFDSTLDSTFQKDYSVVVKIGNTRGGPIATPSTGLCNAVSCTSYTLQSGALRSYFIPQYKLYPASLSGASTTQTSPVITNAISNSYEAVQGQNTHMLLEGTSATIEIPLVSTARNVLTSQVVYSFTAFPPSGTGRQCQSFLKPGFLKIEEVFCEGSNSSQKDCLRLYLGYDPYTGTQKEIPYYMPSVCLLSITALDSSDASAKKVLFGANINVASNQNFDRPLALYFKNVNRPPQLLSDFAGMTLPASFVSPNGDFASESSINDASSRPFDIRPILNQLFYDPDLGSRNIFSGDTTAPLNTAETYFVPDLNMTASPHVIASATTAYFKPEIRFTSSSNHNSGSFSFQVSSDGNSWSNVDSANLIAGPINGLFLEVTTSSDFNGTLSFQRSTDGINWIAVTGSQVLRADLIPAAATFATNHTTAGVTRRYLWTPSGSDALIRAQLTARTSGGVSVTAISNNNNVSGESVAPATTVVMMSLRRSLQNSLNPTVSLTPQNVPNSYRRIVQSDANYGSLFSTTTDYLVDVSDSNSVYIRANYLNASVPQTAVGVVLDSTYNVDPRESSSAIDCYMQDSLLMTTPVPCASFPRDAYNNAPLSIPTIELNPINRSNASPLNLFASLTAAVSGNALASSQRDSKYNVILRYRDSSTASEGSNYTSGYCTGKTCVQTTLAAPIIERETKPTIFATIIKQETQIAALNTGTINLDINKTSPIIQVTGSQSFTEGSTIKLNIRVNPFSDLGYSDFTAVHPVGLQSYTVNLESCQYKGSYCPTRLPDNTLSNTPGQAIFLPPNDAAPESDKDRTGNMFTDNQNGHVGEGNFVFYFQPPKGSATFDNGGTSGSTGEYIYTFKIERNPNTSNSPDNITRFQVKLQVQPGS